MSDTLSNQNWPDNERIICKLREEIDANLGRGTWQEIARECEPLANMSDHDLSSCASMLISNFDTLSGPEMANKVFSKVRHGLTKSDFCWAREKFLWYGNIDEFADAILADSLNELKANMENGTLFYGQPITQEVYQYVREIDDLFYGKRCGGKIFATAIPFRAQAYLQSQDLRTKRYNMCHCQFARESILCDKPVSKTMCYCSLGHNLMFWETALDVELSGNVIMSALNGDVSCKFVIDLPEWIVEKYT